MNNPSLPVTRENEVQAQLLTSSTTTGWLDWIHGELWLLPTGLLRIPLGLMETIRNGAGPTSSRASFARYNIAEKTFETIVTAKGTSWIPREQIKQAYLHRGILTDRLRLECIDQRTQKFLWLHVDAAWEPLQSVLKEWLGSEFFID